MKKDLIFYAKVMVAMCISVGMIWVALLDDADCAHNGLLALGLLGFVCSIHVGAEGTKKSKENDEADGHYTDARD